MLVLAQPISNWTFFLTVHINVLLISLLLLETYNPMEAFDGLFFSLKILFICSFLSIVVNVTQEHRWCERPFGSTCLHNVLKHQKANDLSRSDYICLRGISRLKYPSSR